MRVCLGEVGACGVGVSREVSSQLVIQMFQKANYWRRRIVWRSCCVSRSGQRGEPGLPVLPLVEMENGSVRDDATIRKDVVPAAGSRERLNFYCIAKLILISLVN